MKKLTPVLKDYLWGGYKLKGMFGRDNGGKKISESWEVSVHPDGPCRAGEGTLADYLAANPRAVDGEGSALPVLVKYIDAAQNLSVQVHPDDEYARRVEQDNSTAITSRPRCRTARWRNFSISFPCMRGTAISSRRAPCTR